MFLFFAWPFVRVSCSHLINFFSSFLDKWKRPFVKAVQKQHWTDGRGNNTKHKTQVRRNTHVVLVNCSFWNCRCLFSPVIFQWITTLSPLCIFILILRPFLFSTANDLHCSRLTRLFSASIFPFHCRRILCFCIIIPMQACNWWHHHSMVRSILYIIWVGVKSAMLLCTPQCTRTKFISLETTPPIQQYISFRETCYRTHSNILLLDKC